MDDHAVLFYWVSLEIPRFALFCFPYSLMWQETSFWSKYQKLRCITLCHLRRVSKTPNVMYHTCLVKQTSVDSVISLTCLSLGGGGRLHGASSKCGLAFARTFFVSWGNLTWANQLWMYPYVVLNLRVCICCVRFWMVTTRHRFWETSVPTWAPCNCRTKTPHSYRPSNVIWYQFLAEMLESKVSWLFCLGKLVSAMRFVHLVKQAGTDLVLLSRK